MRGENPTYRQGLVSAIVSVISIGCLIRLHFWFGPVIAGSHMVGLGLLFVPYRPRRAFTIVEWLRARGCLRPYHYGRIEPDGSFG